MQTFQNDLSKNRVARWWMVGLAVIAVLLMADRAPAHRHELRHGLTNSDLDFAFRSIDGWENNLYNPSWGSAGIPLLRLTTVDYADGLSLPAGETRPSARAVSNAIAAQNGPIPNSLQVSSWVWQWGQFLDHDLDLTGPAWPPEPFDIPVPSDDPFFIPTAPDEQVMILFHRSIHNAPETTEVRQQLNEITAFIDASNVYGSDAQRASELRWRGGLLKTSPGRLLPFNVNGYPNAPDAQDPAFFLAGDVRANEQVGLTAVHTLFVREHNRIVRLLRGMIRSAEQRYQVARAIVGAEMQWITYNEFLPILLGPNALAPYSGYNPDVNPAIANIFSTAAYRFGHSMLSSTLWRLKHNGRPIAAGHLALQDAFFAPQEIIAHGIEPILRGLAQQEAQAVDNFLVDDVRNFLFGPPGAGGLDLAALNIQRGRDHGLPGYNQARMDVGLPPVASFAEINADSDVQAHLIQLYGSVDDVDVWVGGLAEAPHNGGLVGELFFTVLKDQFERIRDGDRFWYQIALSNHLVRYVESQTLAQLIQRNTHIGPELQDNVFLVGN